MGGGSSVAKKVLDPTDNKVTREQYEVVFSEWGALGIVMQEYRYEGEVNGRAHVITVTDDAKSKGVRVGSILVSVNGVTFEKMSYREQINFVSNAEWPKTLCFTVPNKPK
jgi:hypothetical protein